MVGLEPPGNVSPFLHWKGSDVRDISYHFLQRMFNNLDIRHAEDCLRKSMTHVYKSMRYALWVLVVTAGTACAQWRHFGEERPASTPSALSRNIVAAHNLVRARVEAPPLVWSGRLAALAQDWANTLLARNHFFHRPNGTHGENLFEIGERV